MAGLADFRTALQMRDVMQQLIRQELNRQRPTYQYATVQTIDTESRKCTVVFPGEVLPVTVSMGVVIQPTQVGQIVRIDGLLGDRFVSDVITPFVDPQLPSWRVVGNAGEPTFAANWSNFGAGWGSAQFMKDPDGWVHLRGLVKHATNGTTTTVFTLPEGYRPPSLTVFAVPANDTFGTVNVNSAGEVAFNGPNANSYLSLHGIRFFAGSITESLIASDGVYSFFPGSASAYDPSIGRMPLLFLREDGFVRSMGTAFMSTGATLGHIGGTPDFMRGQYRDLFGIQAWTGSANDYARADIVSYFTGIYLLDAPTTVGNAFELNFGVWNGDAEAGWIPLPLANGWVNLGTPYSPASYRIDKYGIVHLRGLIRSGTTALGTNIANLPFGFRPLVREMFQAYNNGSCGRLDVEADGRVNVGLGVPLANNDYVSLNQIFYQAA